MFDPALEARVVAAVRALLHCTPDDEGAATHQLCEAASGLLHAFLQLADDWPDDRHIDGLMPLSLDVADAAVELTAAAIVEQGEGWVLQPLLASFAVDPADDALSALSLLFAYADREPAPFDPARQDFALPLPADAHGFRYRLSTEPEEALD